MKKKIFLSLGVAAATIATLPLFAAFEAHVVNVTARIENALEVPIDELTFGTVFPQEKLDKQFDVSLSQSFQGEARVDDVDYFIRQKPKCGIPVPGTNPQEYSGFVQVGEDANGNFVCPQGSEALPLLCPYLSKHEISDDGIAPHGENDGEGLAAFHGPIDLSSWTLDVAKGLDVHGHLAKSQQDLSDKWDIDLKVPCFGGQCAQDWASFVHDTNPTAVAAVYVQPTSNEHQLFGCDLWLEVSGISLPGIGCNKEADVMFVLDRSGSIDSTELSTLKTAAKAFVDAVSPSAAGVHMGQTSFSTTGSLDTHLTDDTTTIKANIDALASTGSTDLEAGITLASVELSNPGDGHDRPDGTSPDIMIIITDGNPNVPDTTQGPADALAAATAAKNAGTTIFVVGVGADVDSTFLKQIASGDDHYVAAANFSDLETVLAGIAQCENPQNETVVVKNADLATDFNDIGAHPEKWYFYNDTNDTVNNTLGTFVSGPSTPPLGTGSAEANPLADSSSRTVLATSGFGGTALSDISAWTYSEYQPSGSWSSSEAPFIRFNVDFSGSSSYQNSLVYVPSTNGTVTQDSWQTWDLVDGGNALWVYSGATWPAPIGGAGTTPHTLSDIKTAFPSIRMHPTFPFVGMRVGEPGPTGLTADLDKFSITISGNTKTFDFEP